MAIDSECYCPDGEPKDSVDQDSGVIHPGQGELQPYSGSESDADVRVE